MKVACVDKSAADRVSLQKFVEEAYEHCRSSLGHLPLAQTAPASKTELLIGSSPDAVIIGPAFPVEDSLVVCQEAKTRHPEAEILVILSPGNFTLRSLRRFQRFTADIFSTDDSKTRLVHRLSTLESSRSSRRTGKLVLVSGVKGGVGATSLTGGLAHAAEALGNTAVVVDLSPCCSLTQYLSSQRWKSPDYAAALTDGIVPDRALVERCITTAPNGISMLLPPSGGQEIRELWIRDPQRFEITLAFIDLLLDDFDVVLVDLANIEGVLAFALQTRADAKLLVSSNDPASVHLLNARLSEAASAPGDANLQILVNMIFTGGLTKEDVLDFLFLNKEFCDSMTSLPELMLDVKGRNWIGTGNSFYTEAAASTQAALEEVLKTLLMSPAELEVYRHETSGLLEELKRIATRPFFKRRKIEKPIRALPAPAAIQMGAGTDRPDRPQRGAEAHNGSFHTNLTDSSDILFQPLNRPAEAG